jgi:hypothetical protein
MAGYSDTFWNEQLQVFTNRFSGDFTPFCSRGFHTFLSQTLIALLGSATPGVWGCATQVLVDPFSAGVNDTFNPRVSPTSFYSMLTTAPSDDQVDAMVHHWLFNASRYGTPLTIAVPLTLELSPPLVPCFHVGLFRFCIAPDGEYTGNGPDCYWGLPSISADDPAFPALGYWRG